MNEVRMARIVIGGRRNSSGVCPGLLDPRSRGKRLDFSYQHAIRTCIIAAALGTGRNWSDVVLVKGVYGADSTLERHLRTTPAW